MPELELGPGGDGRSDLGETGSDVDKIKRGERESLLRSVAITDVSLVEAL